MEFAVCIENSVYLCVQLVEASIRPDTSLVSVMTVNNEIGVKQPIKEISNYGISFLTPNINQKSYFWNIQVSDCVWSKPINNLLAFFFTGLLCRSKGVFFHTDAAQAVGKIPINVSDCKIDLMSISGHKIYGPKGYL